MTKHLRFFMLTLLTIVCTVGGGMLKKRQP